MSEGKLPNFAKLRQDGAYGPLQSSRPLLSPVVWTTIATGKTPDQHGIGHFVAIDGGTGKSLPVTSEMRRVKAVWNILSDAKKTVDVVGWWATWPAETVNGAIVSDHTCYHFLFPQGATGDRESKGLTYPPELFSQIAPLVRRPDDVTREEAAPFIRVSEEEFSRPFDFGDDVSHFKWAVATADSYRKIGLQLWRERRPDLLMVYTEGTDSVSHLFGHLFRAGELSGELAEQQKKFGDAVEQMYLYADRLVGEYMEVMGDDTTLVVLSDHGFELGARQDDPSKTRDMRRVSERFHRMEGVLYMYGKRVKRGRLQEPTTLDIAPTILVLFGLAPARDMPGRVLAEALDLAVPGPAVATYETGAAGVAETARDSTVDPAIMERLRSLGYLGDSDSNRGASETRRSPQGERNLAAVLFEAGRYQESAEAYAKLVEENPEDGSLHTSLAGALGALGRYDEAIRHLDLAARLDPLNVEAYHNRGVILERQGKPDAAIEEYQTAVRYNPQYGPSRRALVRLTGSADVRAPRNDAEKLASALAERASEAARRGDYAEAMKLLAEAERIAPRYPLVYQYQSNVFYLMGDLSKAIQVLENALELEPENALFKTNLERLKAQAAAARR
jgi:predicted AlkP superfamily phosphohydrolase/phosphomutase/Flp pilus assembly protein TadD